MERYLSLEGLPALGKSELLAALRLSGQVHVLPEFSVSPYAAVDYDFMPNTKLLAELNFLPFRARLGLLLRALNSLDLRGWASFFPFSLGASLSLRF